MRRFRIIVVPGQNTEDRVNWQRFVAGCLLAITLVLVVMTLANGIKTLTDSPPTDVASDPSPAANETAAGIGAVPTPSPTTIITAPTSLPPTPTLPQVAPTTPGSAPYPAPIPPTTRPAYPGPGNQQRTATAGPGGYPAPTTAPATTTVSATMTLDPVAEEETAIAEIETANAEEETPTVADGATEEPTATEQTTPTTEEPNPTATSPPATQETTTNPNPTNPPASTAPPTNTPEPTNTSEPTDTPEPDETDTPTPSPIPSPEGIELFGLQIDPGAVESTANRADESGATWVRYNGLLWSDVEATEGERDWSQVESVEDDLRRLNDKGFKVILVLRGTPAWAEEDNNASCNGRIKEEYLDEFASFARESVDRYRNSAYDITYWEIGNAPDRDPDRISGTMPTGWCWGNDDVSDYGGEFYARMLKEVYPEIRAADGDARVVLGSLALECDPLEDSGCDAAEFLKGVLDNDGGSYFDMVAYQSFVYWKPDDIDWDKEFPDWEGRGGALLGKLDFVQDTLEEYHLEKPILASSIGLLCPASDTNCINEDDFERNQANYAVRMYIRAAANDIQGTAWHSLNYDDDQKASLLDDKEQPRQAYDTLQFLHELLQDASFDRTLSSETNAHEGFAFRKDNMEYHVHWTNDQSEFDLDVPDDTEQVYEQDGEERSGDWANEDTVRVGFEPIILEIRR